MKSLLIQLSPDRTKKVPPVAVLMVLGALGFLSLFAPRESHAMEQIIRNFWSARTAGMGGVRYTVGRYEENFFANPARNTANPTWRIQLPELLVETNQGVLDSATGIADAGTDTAAIIDQVGAAAGRNHHLRLQTAFPALYFPNFFGTKMSYALGVFMNTQVDVNLRRSYNIDPLAVVDVGPAFSIARKFLEDDVLSVGLTLRAAYRFSTKVGFGLVDVFKGLSLDPKKMGGEGAGIDTDLGATYTLPWNPLDFEFNVGGAVNNILGGAYDQFRGPVLGLIESLPYPQPRTLNLGASVKFPSIFLIDNSVFAFEITDVGNNTNGSIFRYLHFGAETRLLKVFYPRMGVNQGYLCYGLGIDLRAIHLEVASYGEELSLNTGGYEDRRFVAKVGIQI